MNQFLEKDWINDRQWEYYIIQIDLLLSSKILKDEHQKLINIYKKYSQSKKMIPIQLQEYINLMKSDKDIDKHSYNPEEPLIDYKKVLLIASVIRRQAMGMNKINAINASSKYFQVTPKMFFDIYDQYLQKTEYFLMVEPDPKGLDKLLGI